ncbi:RNA polymerase sigma factor [Glaciecola sp. MH2013]|nr:RNA polymerase sigma factor [Glaciecola sp. MH2013]
MLKYAKTQNSALLARLYDNCAHDLLTFLSTLSDQDLAEEIAQRTWLKVIDKAHLYGQQGQFKSWLFTLGRRTLIDEYRKQNRFVELDEQEIVPQAAIASEQISTEATVSNAELNSDFLDAYDRALSKLSFVQKEAFCLQQEGFSLAEIASITNMEQESIKSRLRYAKQSLRTALHDLHPVVDSTNDKVNERVGEER